MIKTRVPASSVRKRRSASRRAPPALFHSPPRHPPSLSAPRKLPEPSQPHGFLLCAAASQLHGSLLFLLCAAASQFHGFLLCAAAFVVAAVCHAAPARARVRVRKPQSQPQPLRRRQVALLLSAAYDGYLPKIKKLVKRLEEHSGMSVAEAVAGVEVPWNKGHGPLHMAASAGKVKACKFLIKEVQLDVNAIGTDGATPLYCAVYGSGSLAVVKFLLNHQANPSRVDSHGCSPLHIAAIRGTYEIVEELLSRGAYADPMWECKSPLYIAAQRGHTRMMELLLRHGAEPNNNLVYTPLKAAIFARSLVGMELLIKADAGVNFGLPETPLIAAAAAGLTDFVKRLLEAGANANTPDDNGRIAIEIAAIQGWQQCVEVLFPFTDPLARVADWSIDGVTQHAKLMSSEPQGPVFYEVDESDYEAEGDAASNGRDYSHALTLYTMSYEVDETDYEAEGDAASNGRDYSRALTLYTMAMEIDPNNATLYAKRSLCFLNSGHQANALEDATTYVDMQP